MLYGTSLVYLINKQVRQYSFFPKKGFLMRSTSFENFVTLVSTFFTISTRKTIRQTSMIGSNWCFDVLYDFDDLKHSLNLHDRKEFVFRRSLRF